jgi:hypothetical protein
LFAQRRLVCFHGSHPSNWSTIGSCFTTSLPLLLTRFGRPIFDEYRSRGSNRLPFADTRGPLLRSFCDSFLAWLLVTSLLSTRDVSFILILDTLSSSVFTAVRRVVFFPFRFWRFGILFPPIETAFPLCHTPGGSFREEAEILAVVWNTGRLVLDWINRAGPVSVDFCPAGVFVILAFIRNCQASTCEFFLFGSGLRLLPNNSQTPKTRTSFLNHVFRGCLILVLHATKGEKETGFFYTSNVCFLDNRKAGQTCMVKKEGHLDLG